MYTQRLQLLRRCHRLPPAGVAAVVVAAVGVAAAGKIAAPDWIDVAEKLLQMVRLQEQLARRGGYIAAA